MPSTYSSTSTRRRISSLTTSGTTTLGLGREVPPQGRGVAGLLPEVELVRDPLGELAHDRGDRAGVMVGEQQVEQKEDAEGDVQILADHVLHAGPQDLDHDLAALVGGPVHLAQRGRGERLGVEPVEEPADVVAQLRPDHPLGHARRQRRAPGR